MATVDRKRTVKPIYYPESDGKPIGETENHRDNLTGFIEMLKDYYADNPMVYISGNMFLYFVEGDPRKVVCPDVFLALGVERRVRPIYCTWREGGKCPDLVVEMTSPKTKKEDAVKKFLLYQDVLQVREYFRFDPLDEYLKPPLQGHRRVEGRYEPIDPVDGRLPSEVTGLHLFKDGTDLKAIDPATGQTFLTLDERRRELRRAVVLIQEQAQQAEAERLRADDQARQAEAERLRADDQARQAERALAEVDRLRRELEELRKLQAGGSA